MRRYIVATILFLALAGTAQAATPSDEPAWERRTALVIGNGDYELISPLRNPVNDARAMARVLRDLGFEVIARENLTQKEMKQAIRDFGRALGQGGVGLFYYAGHGMEVGGENFMIPLNAPIQFEDDVDVEAVSVNLLLAKLGSAANRLNIVILDACRNNPYARSFGSSASGLAFMDAPTGTLIAYAAAPGRLAMDGEGVNGLYTGELLNALPLPGLKIEDVFKRVRVAVQEKSGTQQVPWESSSLTGDFYFRPPALEAATETSEAAADDRNADDRLFWESIKCSTDPEMLEAYLDQYPKGAFATLARIWLKKLEEPQTAALVPPPEPETEISVEPVTVVSPPEPEAQPAVEPAVGIYPQAYNPGEIFKDCDECPEMVVVPGGSFLMGSPVDERGRAKSEGPQHQVSIASAFAVGIDEVTFAEWDACVVDGGCGGYRPKDEGWGRDERPAIYVNWNDAKVYVEWLKSETGQKYRLLTESEWEYAARAGTTTAYHWVSRTRFPWTQNWLNRSVQGGPEHDRQF